MYSKDALNSLLQEEMKYYYQAAEIISANHHNIILSILSKESKELFILKILDRRYYNKSLYQKIFSITGNSLLIPFQTFTDTSYIYFVYPHLNTLTEALSTKTINYSTLYTLIFSIGNAAASLHEHNILHLDITPNNIFLDNEGKCYLGDFSSALPIRDIQSLLSRRYLRTGTTCSFALPEQTQVPSVSYWNDCYSFVLLCYALFNRGKFPHETILPPTQAIEKINSFLTKWMKCPSHIGPSIIRNFLTELDDILNNCNEEKELLNYSLKLSDCDSGQNCFLEKTPDYNIENFSFSKTAMFPLHFNKKGHRLRLCPSKNAKEQSSLHLLLVHHHTPRTFLIYQRDKRPVLLYGLLIFCSFLFLFSLYHYLSKSSRREEKQNIILSKEIETPPTETMQIDTSPSCYPAQTSIPLASPASINTGLPDKINHKDKRGKKHILDISDNPNQNISFLKNKENISNLHILFANCCRLSTCSAFSSLSSLKELYLNSNQIISPIGLTGLSKLEVLVLSNNKLSDISCLSKLRNLTVLDLSHNCNLKNLKTLSSLTKLRCLILTNTNASEKEIQFLQKKLPSCTILY